MEFISQLETAYQENSNPENALPMAKYMKNKFPFYGIKTTERRLLFKTIWKQNQQEVSVNARTIALVLYAKEQRELHYCAIEILIKELKGNYKKDDIVFIEKLIITNSWWDSVDTIAKYILGQYLIEFPDYIETTVEKFSNFENMWLNRSAILFQLGYKKETDFELLKAICTQHQSATEFFIQKAIGWALREYSKTDSEAVKNFVLVNNLKPLSRKEALKNLPIA
jgi:3-methyladenine DNA glycosylase AlkD